MKTPRAHFRRPTGRTWCAALFLVFLGAFGLGCSPKIGDACTSSVKCSAKGDRLCDSTQPDGYCTIFNCEPDGCPDDAICVAFNETSCANVTRSGRILRTYCLAGCDDDSDCRGGYYCKEVGSSDPGMQIIDNDPPKRRICTVKPNGVQASVISIDAAICEPGDGSLPPVEVPDGDAALDADAPADAALQTDAPSDVSEEHDGSSDAPGDASVSAD